MKKILLTAIIVLMAETSYCQFLKKGNVISVTNVIIKPKPGVTIDQYIKYFIEKAKPFVEEHYVGSKIYVTKGIAGEYKNSIGIIFIFETLEDSRKYFNKDGSFTEATKAIKEIEETNPAIQGLYELGEKTVVNNTDWVVL